MNNKPQIDSQDFLQGIAAYCELPAFFAYWQVALSQDNSSQTNQNPLPDFIPYRNQKMGKNENRQTDHTISAHEIHDDPGRILADKPGVDLANQDSNLNSTHACINNLKRDQAQAVEKFLNEIDKEKMLESDKKGCRPQSGLYI